MCFLLGILERGKFLVHDNKKSIKNGRRVPKIQRHLEEGKRGVSKTVNKRGRYLVVSLYFNRNKQYRMGGMLKFLSTVLLNFSVISLLNFCNGISLIILLIPLKHDHRGWIQICEGMERPLLCMKKRWDCSLKRYAILIFFFPSMCSQ